MPSWTILPSSRTTTRSARTRASSGSCVTSTVGPPKPLKWWDTIALISTLEDASSAANGSSSRSASGCPASARASAARCFSPPEMLCGRAPVRSPSSKVPMISATRCRASVLPAPEDRAAKRMFSSIVMCGNRRRSWNINPTLRASGRTKVRGPSRSRPPSVTLPQGPSKPASARKSVVLPAPLGPRRTTISPASTSSLASKEVPFSSTRTSADRLTIVAATCP